MDIQDTPAVKWDRIMALDLRSVGARLAWRRGWWWRVRNPAGVLEREYRRFLFLIVMNPGETVVPWSKALDEFWHEHILDTAKYARDCEAILGAFIHHNPHLPEGTTRHAVAYVATQKMYRLQFGASMPGSVPDLPAARGKLMTPVSCAAAGGFFMGDGGGGHHADGGHGGHHGADGGGHGHGGDGGGHGGGHGCGGHSGCGGHGGH